MSSHTRFDARPRFYGEYSVPNRCSATSSFHRLRDSLFFSDTAMTTLRISDNAISGSYSTLFWYYDI